MVVAIFLARVGSMFRFISAALLTSVSLGVCALAQDARTVTEPVLPPVCTVLGAHLASVADGPYRSLAPADEAKLDTDRIQSAIDTCAKGKAVALRGDGKNDAFVSGPLKLKPGVTLLVDKGATLFAALDFNLYAVRPGSCGVVSDGKGRGCKPLITVDHAADAGIMGDGIIDGRGGVTIPGKTVSAWDIAHDGQGGRILPRLVIAQNADNFTLYRITLKNSPNFHVVYNGGDGFTVWGVKISTPQRFPRSAHPLAHNTDGIDPGNGAKNITITHSYIRTGDDNVAIKGDGKGLTNMTVSHSVFYYGHGMSIGSGTAGGVSKVRVFDLVLDGTDNGLRIKSAGNRGGLVHDVSYENICIRNSPHPIMLTGSYGSDGASRGDSPPVYKDITFRNVGISGGGEVMFFGYDPEHRVAAALDGLFATDTAKLTYKFEHADVTYAPGGSNLALPAGTDATLAGAPSQGMGPNCAGRFVPFPE
jgi:polygalacturonase